MLYLNGKCEHQICLATALCVPSSAKGQNFVRMSRGISAEPDRLAFHVRAHANQLLKCLRGVGVCSMFPPQLVRIYLRHPACALKVEQLIHKWKFSTQESASANEALGHVTGTTADAYFRMKFFRVCYLTGAMLLSHNDEFITFVWEGYISTD